MIQELQNSDIPVQIIPAILHKFKDHLTAALVDGIPDNGLYKPSIIKIGRFIENPVNNNVVVSLAGGDYEDPDFMDGRIDLDGIQQIRIPNLPAGEIGGGIYWWRRGIVQIQVFYVRQRYPEEVAHELAYEFYGRVHKSFEEIQLSIVDDFGERAYGNPFIESSTFYQSGGNNQFAYRGKIRWRVLTWRP